MTSEIAIEAPVLSAGELYERLLHQSNLFILDVRNEQDYARWRVEGRSNLAGINLPYYDFLEDEEAAIARIPADREVLVVCAKEGSSQYVAGLLGQHGITASYLEGGIVSWGDYYDLRTVAEFPAGKIIQVARPARGDVSFVVISDGAAAVIDPLRHIAHYQALVEAAGARFTALLDTHVHADHISGGPALAAASGATYYVHAYDAIHPIDMLPARIAYTHIDESVQISLGRTTIKTIWYPGHTLGQVNYLLEEPDGGRYLFTGDGIFLRSFGRPDLGGRGEAWTPVLYESMYERLPRHLTDATMIMPSHFSTLDEGGENGMFLASWANVQRDNERSPGAAWKSLPVSCSATCRTFRRSTSRSSA